ncbi:MAG: Ig-like domain-containing protein, partial [bacterium]
TQAFESTFTSGNFADAVAPTVLRTSPPTGATDVPVNAPFTVEFSEAMDPATLTTTNFSVRDNATGQLVPGMVQVDPEYRTASYVPEQPWAVGRSHTASLNSLVKDAARNSLSSQFFNSFDFTTGFAADTQAPQLVATSPADGDTGVATNALIMIAFDEPVNPVTLVRAFRVAANGQQVAGSIALSGGNRVVTLTTGSALAASTLHTVEIGALISDLAGNLIANPGSFSFQTGQAADTVRPTITSVEPANNSVDIPTNVKIQVTFSERVNPISVTESTFFLTDFNTGAMIPGSISVAPNRLSASFVPAALAGSTKYRVTVSGVTDLTAQTASFFSSTFTTGLGADGDGPMVVAVSPPDGTTGVPVNARVVVQLNEPVSALSVGSEAIQVSSAGGAVGGAISLSTDRR